MDERTTDDWLDAIFEPYVQSLKQFKDNSPTAYGMVKDDIQAHETAAIKWSYEDGEDSAYAAFQFTLEKHLDLPAGSCRSPRNAVRAIKAREREMKRNVKEASRSRPKLFKVYVLALEGGFYYVGMTNQHDVQTRFDQHLAGTGAWWTRFHRPLKVIEVRELNTASYHDASIQENLLTLEYMDRYGLDLVRGGIVTSPVPEEAEKWLGYALRLYRDRSSE